MKILPDDSLFQVWLQAKEVSSQLLGIFLDAIAQNIVESWFLFMGALSTHEWTIGGSCVLLLIGSIILGYRIVRDNPIDAATHVLNK